MTGQFISRDPAVSSTREPYAYVNDNLLNAIDPAGLATVGKCVNLSVNLILFHASAEACVVIDSSGQTAGTFTYGGGGATASLKPGISLQKNIQVSNADTVQDLAGPFGYLGGGAAFPIGPVPFSCGGNGFIGNGTPGQTVVGAEGGAGVGGPPGLGIQGRATNTVETAPTTNPLGALLRLQPPNS